MHVITILIQWVKNMFYRRRKKCFQHWGQWSVVIFAQILDAFFTSVFIPASHRIITCYNVLKCNVEILQLSNWTYVLVLHLAMLVYWYILNHMTVLSNFVAYSCWDSVYFLLTISILFVQHFLLKNGDKLLEPGINIIFLMILIKNAVDI
jgi:hypothetical protein